MLIRIRLVFSTGDLMRIKLAALSLLVFSVQPAVAEKSSAAQERFEKALGQISKSISITMEKNKNR